MTLTSFFHSFVEKKGQVKQQINTIPHSALYDHTHTAVRFRWPSANVISYSTRHKITSRYIIFINFQRHRTRERLCKNTKKKPISQIMNLPSHPIYHFPIHRSVNSNAVQNKFIRIISYTHFYISCIVINMIQKSVKYKQVCVGTF